MPWRQAIWKKAARGAVVTFIVWAAVLLFTFRDLIFHKALTGAAQVPFSISVHGKNRRLHEPISTPNKCRLPELEIMVKFKGGETVYRCLVCEAVVSSRASPMLAPSFSP